MERHNYQLLISQYVIDEISKGDPILAQERMTIVADIPVIGINDELSNLAEVFLKATLLPPRARLDALHICAAVIGGVDYLLTWNCTHIANARTLPRVHDFFAQLGHRFPVVCTPEELLDDEYPIT